MTDRAALSAITHGDLPYHQPIRAERIDGLLERIPFALGDRTLDVGCGPGELLIRVAERTGAGGLGIDLAEVQIERAQAAAKATVDRLAELTRPWGRVPRAVAVVAATEEEWDAYEWGLIANGERHLAGHPADPLGPALREWVDRARDRYLAPGGRDTLGFAVVLWQRGAGD